MDDTSVSVSDHTLLDPGRNCWRIEQAGQLSVIIDAADYFGVVREAMLKAERRIMLIGWDFDGRVWLSQKKPGDAPPEVGKFILWLANNRPELEIFLLRWDMGVVKTLFRGTTPITLLKWKMHKRIQFRLDSAHPFGASHHQKIVVIDDCLAFCGGIDITSRRWDTREHADDDPRRVSPGGTHHDPWHDATLAFDGPAAAALGELARERWKCSGGGELKPVERTTSCWPDNLAADFRNLKLAVARTRPTQGDVEEVHEIEALYLDLIARARHSIYAESQYFASRKLAEALARRLAEPEGPEVVLVNPEQADGWLEQEAMDTARARLFEALRRVDPHGRLRIYHPFTPGGVPIYVHAKIMIVDDQFMRVGSSNWNNRSLRLDTECDMLVDASLASDPAVAAATITALRDGLIAEHLAVEPARVADAIATCGSLRAAIDRLSTGGKLRRYERRDLTSIEKYLADHEVLDPEGPEEMFEPVSKRTLFRRLRRPERKS